MATLRDLYEAQLRVFARRPELARGSGHSSVRTIESGVACAVEHEDRTVLVDLPRDEGGSATAPDPAQLMRASLGASLAMGYRVWGERLGVSVERVELDISCEYDARGQMGLDDAVPVGWKRVVIQVRVTSRADGADVRRVVEMADRLSPMLANLSAGIPRVHHLMILRPR